MKKGSFGKLSHRRAMSAIDEQDVVRMNRDTIYSSGVFDLEASPLAVTLPDAGKRFMSMQVISQDHFTIEVEYASRRYTYTKEKVGTRYVFILVRTLANPADPKDMEAAHALQDAIKTEQASMGSFESPNWDATSQDKLRAALDVLGSLGGLAATSSETSRKSTRSRIWLLQRSAGAGTRSMRRCTAWPTLRPTMARPCTQSP